MLREYRSIEPFYAFEGEKPKLTRCPLDSKFIEDELGITAAEAAELLSGLIAEGYIDGTKRIPTPHGMALINAEDRERIPRNEADRILTAFLAAVRAANLRDNARVFIEEAHVFGSYDRGAADLGDVDILLKVVLPEDCTPEVMDEHDDVVASVRVSEYLSFHDEFDLVAAQAPKRLIYDRRSETVASRE
jgi:predicted nucleotidyltransferase